jgi:hypothetical protein
MSDTAAFIAGCAVTGVAAVLLARGDLAAGQIRSAPTSQPAQTAPTQTVMGTLSPTATDDPNRMWQIESQFRQQQESQGFGEQLKQHQLLAEDFKTQLAKQQTENETLKAQINKQQSSTDLLVAQLQEQQRYIDRITTQEQFRNTFDLSNQSNGWQTAIFVVGAIVLIVIIGGAGILLVMMVMMWMNNQGSSRRKQTRTVHVVHPMPTPYGLAHPQAVLPAKSGARRQPRHIDVDYYSD